LPYHWGTGGLSRGDSANDLLSMVGDPNVQIPESKVFTGNIVPGRRSRAPHAAAVALLIPGSDAPDLGDARDVVGVAQRAPRPPRYRR
jgi:formate dehydrogenase major subunit